jgi:hypothetical protein
MTQARRSSQRKERKQGCAAAALSEGTLERDWRRALAFLHGTLGEDRRGPPRTIPGGPHRGDG